MKAGGATHGAMVESKESPARQLAGFVAKYDPAVAKLARATRAALRKRMSATERPSDCVVSLAISPKGVALSFNYGSTLPDPKGILLGSGNQNRYVRLDSAESLAIPAVEALLRAAIDQARTPLAANGRGYTVIKSVSSKQHPRRAPEKSSSDTLERTRPKTARR